MALNDGVWSNNFTELYRRLGAGSTAGTIIRHYYGTFAPILPPYMRWSVVKSPEDITLLHIIGNSFDIDDATAPGKTLFRMVVNLDYPKEPLHHLIEIIIANAGPVSYSKVVSTILGLPDIVMDQLTTAVCDLEWEGMHE